jgi:DNA-directed RNA polymerase subunit H (RpoH/RPB5)
MSSTLPKREEEKERFMLTT